MMRDCQDELSKAVSTQFGTRRALMTCERSLAALVSRPSRAAAAPEVAINLSGGSQSGGGAEKGRVPSACRPGRRGPVLLAERRGVRRPHPAAVGGVPASCVLALARPAELAPMAGADALTGALGGTLAPMGLGGQAAGCVAALPLFTYLGGFVRGADAACRSNRALARARTARTSPPPAARPHTELSSRALGRFPVAGESRPNKAAHAVPRRERSMRPPARAHVAGTRPAAAAALSRRRACANAALRHPHPGLLRADALRGARLPRPGHVPSAVVAPQRGTSGGAARGASPRSRAPSAPLTRPRDRPPPRRRRRPRGRGRAGRLGRAHRRRSLLRARIRDQTPGALARRSAARNHPRAPPLVPSPSPTDADGL